MHLFSFTCLHLAVRAALRCHRCSLSHTRAHTHTGHVAGVEAFVKATVNEKRLDVPRGVSVSGVLSGVV